MPAKIKPLFSLFAVSRPHTNITFHCACRRVVVMPSMLPLCLSSSCIVPTVSGTKQNLQPAPAFTCSPPPCSGPPVLLKDLQVIPTPAPTWRLLMNGCGMPVPQWIALFSELVQCRSSHCDSEVSLQTDGWRVITAILPHSELCSTWLGGLATYPQLLFQKVPHKTNGVNPVNPKVSCYID